MKVLVATEKPFAAAAVNGIKAEVEAAGNELVLLEKYTEKAQLLDAVKDADALIIRSDKVDAEVLDAAKQLKIVVRAGAGYDNIDLAAATVHNVVGIAWDRDALGVSNLDRRVTTNWNPKAEFTNNWYKFDAGYFNDFNENIVVFTLGEPTNGAKTSTKKS